MGIRSQDKAWAQVGTLPRAPVLKKLGHRSEPFHMGIRSQKACAHVGTLPHGHPFSGQSLGTGRNPSTGTRSQKAWTQVGTLPHGHPFSFDFYQVAMPEENEEKKVKERNPHFSS